MRTLPQAGTARKAATAPKQERRKTDRTPANVPLKGPPAGELKPGGALVELSEGGAAVRLGVRYEKGMVLHLRLPNGIDIQGEVVNILPLEDGTFRHGLWVHRAGPATPQILPPYMGRKRVKAPAQAAAPAPAPVATEEPAEDEEEMRLLGGSN
ncbi:MAG: PilZ domain-containing protein [Elusimicrobiota bacterium]|jgi:hypothetical protein